MLDVALFTLRGNQTEWITRMFENIERTAKMTHHWHGDLQVLLRRLVLGHVLDSNMVASGTPGGAGGG